MTAGHRVIAPETAQVVDLVAAAVKSLDVVLTVDLSGSGWLEGFLAGVDGVWLSCDGPPFGDVIGPGRGSAVFVPEAGVVAGGE